MQDEQLGAARLLGPRQELRSRRLCRRHATQGDSLRSRRGLHPGGRSGERGSRMSSTSRSTGCSSRRRSGTAFVPAGDSPGRCSELFSMPEVNQLLAGLFNNSEVGVAGNCRKAFRDRLHLQHHRQRYRARVAESRDPQHRGTGKCGRPPAVSADGQAHGVPAAVHDPSGGRRDLGGTAVPGRAAVHRAARIQGPRRGVLTRCRRISHAGCREQANAMSATSRWTLAHSTAVRWCRRRNGGVRLCSLDMCCSRDIAEFCTTSRSSPIGMRPTRPRSGRPVISGRSVPALNLSTPT